MVVKRGSLFGENEHETNSNSGLQAVCAVVKLFGLSNINIHHFFIIDVFNNAINVFPFLKKFAAVDNL